MAANMIVSVGLLILVTLAFRLELFRVCAGERVCLNLSDGQTNGALGDVSVRIRLRCLSDRVVGDLFPICSRRVKTQLSC